MASEIWKQIAGFEVFYEVSNLGRVRSLNYGGHVGNVRVLKGTNLGGYRRYDLTAGGKRRCVFGHILVLEAFVGPAPAGYEECHENGIRDDNALSNLRWDTPIGNQADRLKHGTHSRGERSGKAKITAAEAAEIKRRRKAGEAVRSIAKDFNIGERSVYHIAAQERWKEVYV